jgi:16S rRNA (cytidine1402-2'-O)-methyltransferase
MDAKIRKKHSLFIVATPIGNLEDISLRALRVLKEVDFIACESPRHSQRLLKHYQIETPVIPLSRVIDYLKRGKDVALISSAGTPCISDPGSRIIQEAKDMVEISPVPGASALIAAASISGFSVSRFLFLGFIPKKRKRKRFFEEIEASKKPVIFYESPHRIVKTLGQLPKDRQIVLCRELTKIHETIYRGRAEEVLEQLEKDKIRGEFVVVVEGKRNKKRKSPAF